MNVLIARLALSVVEGVLNGDAQEHDPARSWFDKMRAALEGAKTPRVESRQRELDGAKMRWTFFREGDRVSLMGTPGEEPHPIFRTVSDGKRRLLAPFPNERDPAPQGFAGQTLALFAQFGCMQFVVTPPGAAGKWPRLSGFSPRDPEELEGRQVRGVRYRASWEGIAEVYEITLWLDEKSALPVKRSVKSTFRWSPLKGEKGRFIAFDEVYTLVRLNDPIPEGTFWIPPP